MPLPTSQDGNQSFDNSLEFHAVIVPEYEGAYVISAATPGELATKLALFTGTRIYVFPFQGKCWFISKGPTHRRLLAPNGIQSFNLYVIEPNLEPDYTGSLAGREESIQDRVKR